MPRRKRTPDASATLFPFELPAEPEFSPRILAGLDEAGYGPMLGPLTIGCVALRSPEGIVDPWQKLARVVSRAHERDPARLCVGDSKAVFERNERGRARLERTVLAFHAVLHGVPADGRAFLAATRPPLSCAELEREFWLAHLASRLSAAAEPTIEEAQRNLAAALHSAQLEVALCAVRAVPTDRLNASFARTGSKGATHWEECSPFLLHLWREFASEGVELVVDRHGGRMRYASLLAATIPDAEVTTVSEIAARSVYLLRDPRGRRLRVTFAEKADTLSFPVALASCCAKYARELCMDAFNGHFAGLQAGLEPTAGYVTDARRWLEDAGPALRRAGLAREALVRTR
ncbi:MAG: hypothetical protein NTY35_08280 [Planctomycetota bacterium]|nr:hypothetical protein [Planctomycetota bacterium]